MGRKDDSSLELYKSCVKGMLLCNTISKLANKKRGNTLNNVLGIKLKETLKNRRKMLESLRRGIVPYPINSQKEKKYLT